MSLVRRDLTISGKPTRLQEDYGDAVVYLNVFDFFDKKGLTRDVIPAAADAVRSAAYAILKKDSVCRRRFFGALRKEVARRRLDLHRRESMGFFVSPKEQAEHTEAQFASEQQAAEPPNLGSDPDFRYGQTVEDMAAAIAARERVEEVEPEEAPDLAEAYIGFKKLVQALKKRKDVKDPEAVAAAIGRKKYGAKKFQQFAAKGKKMRGVKPAKKAEAESDGRLVIVEGFLSYDPKQGFVTE